MPLVAGHHYFLHEGGSTLRPPLVLIHGAGGDYLSWPAELRRLPGVRVFSLDLSGHGNSEGLGRQSIVDYASSVVDFMNAAGLSRAVFGGHGMGGAIALALALDHPARVAGMILISTGSRLPIPPDVIENGASPSTIMLAIKSLQEFSFHPDTSAALQETVFKRLTHIRQTQLYRDWLACDRFDVSGRLEMVKTPTLVVCGKDDKLTPLHFSETLASCIPGAALQTVDEAGHMLILEQPLHLAKLISVFLSTILYTPGM
jgi:pimeloyl-ACP methyl ester carboxylesterase